MNTDAKLYLIPITTIVILLLALFNMPYEYYKFLQIAVTISTAGLAYLFYKNKNIVWFIVLSLFAILYNPIIIIRISKAEWKFIDLVLIALFSLVTYHLYKDYKKSIEDKIKGNAKKTNISKDTKQIPENEFIAIEQYGKAGKEIIDRLNAGNLKAREMHKWGLEKINEIKEITKYMQPLDKQDIHKKVIACLQDNAKADGILGNDQKAGKVYNIALEFYDFFKLRLKEGGTNDVRENNLIDDFYSHNVKRIIYAKSLSDLGTPESKAALIDYEKKTSMFLYRTHRRIEDISNNLEDILLIYLLSVKKEIGYKNMIDYYYGNFIRDIPQNKKKDYTFIKRLMGYSLNADAEKVKITI